MAEYSSSFTITVVGVILLSFILRALMPRSALEKYVNFIIGVLVTITLIGSFTGIPQLDFDEIVSADTSDALTKENAAMLYNEKITDNFRINLEQSVREYVQSVYGMECDAEAMLTVGEDGTAAGIDGIYIRMYGTADMAAVRRDVSSQFGIPAEAVHIE